jgi:hypothetical protein
MGHDTMQFDRWVTNVSEEFSSSILRVEVKCT